MKPRKINAEIEGDAEVGVGCWPQQATPCECKGWARLFDGTHDKGTEHHPNCPHVDDSLIDVWRVQYDGRHYYTAKEPTAADLYEDEVVTKERMHREIFNRLPDFAGF